MAAGQDLLRGSTARQFARAFFSVSMIVLLVGLLKINKATGYCETSVI